MLNNAPAHYVSTDLSFCDKMNSDPLYLVDYRANTDIDVIRAAKLLCDYIPFKTLVFKKEV